jgi:1-acyl-sn-glycerol-3-phosphate acyltransferase
VPLRSQPPADDPVALRSPGRVRFFSRYMRRYLQKNFHAFRISREGLPRLPPDRPAIVYCNHPAWWDPLLVIVLGDAFFAGRPGYGPMDSAMLAKYGVMRRIGLFGVEPDTRRGAARFLRVGAHILQQPDAMLWVTAQGGFTDVRARPLRLKGGVAALLDRVDNAVCLPLAIEYPFWNERYPEALCRFGEAVDNSVGDIESALVDSLTETMDALAAEAMSRDPARFETIVGGAVGIGGVYDAGRWLKALLRGRRFDPSHAGSDEARRHS